MYPDFKAVIGERRRALTDFLAQALGPAPSFVWEVGCGHGHFLTAYAEAHTREPCIGVDLASDRIARAMRKRNRSGLAHLHFVQGDARLFLDAVPPGVSISSVFILFPDPWPKLRHHKHRIIQPAFLTQLRPKVREGARIYLRTDFEPYFEDARLTFLEHPQWRLVDEAWPFEYETVFQQRAATHCSLIAAPR
ncbi:tRNA (guanosine(46)-N7)-methyltransferase TrmB [Opitutus terrae]|uniref:tRNA (guanine-N(7)-)-methyltransferase n=1 Tax=Opitutus terrae (strain DSM 11246 / JCM 15787 / PB90-1) TaxID=452637 RepID=B1ZWP3_OPITP|nr:tRNA (guanosine(46)-N7)-methyltransferase TrmB [Opitutus terrae]ACB74170.1 putative methyltransferase [Opitutus terrae PB90-1]